MLFNIHHKFGDNLTMIQLASTKNLNIELNQPGQSIT